MLPTRTLPRAERLRSFGAIRRLFAEGESGFVYPFRYLYVARSSDSFSAEVLFSVPKKMLRRAACRNLVRRRTKEAYRLNKTHLGTPLLDIDVAFVYASKQVADYKTVEHAVVKILEQISQRL